MKASVGLRSGEEVDQIKLVFRMRDGMGMAWSRLVS